MGFSSKSTSRNHFRSISLPCRSHPSTQRIDQLLNRVKTWETTLPLSNPSSETICRGVSHLTELYECLDDLFKTSLPQTSSITSNENKKWTDELLDVTVTFLDIFNNTTDVMSHIKQNVRDLGCDLRRNGGFKIESIIAKYILFRKQMRKDIKVTVATLKQVDNMVCGCSFTKDDSENHHLTSMIRVSREVNALAVVILGFLLEFLAMPLLKTRPTRRWTSISKYLSNGKVLPEEKADTNINEIQRLEAALFGYSTSNKQEFLPIVQKKLQELEATVDGINSHLELMSRRLIATRASLLNLVSFY